MPIHTPSEKKKNRAKQAAAVKSFMSRQKKSKK